ncbi:MAG: Bifunctional protein HldE [Candidatus Anoxychlamydiales bacterium]|nr:Bifunctional protein HldE [Candidatus Anoxychlamydiales bacterium]
MYNKIKSLKEIGKILNKHKKKGEKIVQCHGVFDLLHPGHIRHFKEAKKKGDKLVVSITPDRFVNKGPGRPAFNEKLRLESIAALSSVDYVVMNNSKDAINAIKVIKPDFYVKGKEYKDAKKDITGKIIDEENAVKINGGQIYFTDDIVFSSSSLINKYVEPISEEAKSFIEKLKVRYSIEQIVEKVKELSSLKVLIIGDAIIDEYQYVDLLGQSAKGQHLVANCKEAEKFLGGSLIIANHISEFCENVTLLTNLGKNCHYLDFINSNLNNNIKLKRVFSEKHPTLHKKRYVSKDGKHLSKLFETYSSNEDLLSQNNIKQVKAFIEKEAKNFDLVLVCDFGNGFLNAELKNEISKVSSFLAINTQINSGNRGFNVITQYDRADFISLNGPEIRLAAHDKENSLEEVTKKIATQMKCNNVCVTLGVKGSYCFSSIDNISEIVPAFATNTVDRVGAGDSFFSLAALCMAKGYSSILSTFIGSIAAAIDVNIIGNKEHIKKEGFLKFLVRMLR